MGLRDTATATLAVAGDRLVRPVLLTIDRRLVVPRLGERSPVHQVLTAAVAAVSPHHAPPPVSEPSRAATPEAEPLTEQDRTDVEELADELLEDQRDDRFVGELADEEIRRVQAEVRAKQLLEDPEHP